MVKLRFLVIVAVMALGISEARGQQPGNLPPYKPEQKATQVLRSWGSEEMAGLMTAWEQGFRKFQPDLQFADTLKGNETAQAALYTEVADLALMGREILPLEWYPLFRRKHHFPLEITVATGSYDVANKTFALAVLVNKDNPISKLTLKQLDGIFGEARSGGWDNKLQWHSELARGAEGNIRTWGQLGLTGEWKDQPIHVYGYPNSLWAPSDIAPGAVQFFRNRVMGGADKWNSELIEFDKGELIADALSKDRFGIAYAGMPFKTPSIRPVALATSDGGGYVECTKANVTNRTYPLTRSIYIFIDRTPGQPVDPKVREFLRYILSREGQQAVARDGGYLPLTAEEVRTQLKKLE